MTAPPSPRRQNCLRHHQRAQVAILFILLLQLYILHTYWWWYPRDQHPRAVVDGNSDHISDGAAVAAALAANFPSTSRKTTERWLFNASQSEPFRRRRSSPFNIHRVDASSSTKLVVSGVSLRGQQKATDELPDSTEFSRSLPYLNELTRLHENSNASCPPGLVYVANRIGRSHDRDVNNDRRNMNDSRPNGIDVGPPMTRRFNSDHPTTTTIPRIIHQTSKSRCVARPVAGTIAQWQRAFPDFDYYLHDDAAMMQLLQSDAAARALDATLPAVMEYCLTGGTMRADVWRYVVLYCYGGIYADLDTVPTKLVNESQHLASADALFVVEQYHLLSQYFMAATPRHPIMKLATQQALGWARPLPDIGHVPTAVVTGPHALHRALMRFVRLGNSNVIMAAARPGHKPVHAGTYDGPHQRSVTAMGRAEMENEYVRRDALGSQKFRSYDVMGMRHFRDEPKQSTNVSCQDAMAQHAEQRRRRRRA